MLRHAIMVVLVVTVMLAGVVAPLAQVARATGAQGAGTAGGTQGNVTLKLRAEVLLDILGRALNASASIGVNVSSEYRLYNESLKLYDEGSYTASINASLEAMRELAGALKSRPAQSVPRAVGIRAQLIAIEAFVNTTQLLNSSEKELIISKVNYALGLLSKGNVSRAAQVLDYIKSYLANASVRESQYAKHEAVGHIARELAKVRAQLNLTWGNASEGLGPMFSWLQARLNSSAANASPAQLVAAARGVRELEDRASELFPPFPQHDMALFASEALWSHLNHTLSRIERMADHLGEPYRNLSLEAINLTERSIEDTVAAVNESLVEGNITGGLKLLNTSIDLANESLSIASNLTESGNGLAMAVGYSIKVVDLRVIAVDKGLYSLLEDELKVINKTMEFEGVALFEVNSTAYLALLRPVNSTTFGDMYFRLSLIIIASNTNVTGNLTELPAHVVVVGRIVSIVRFTYIINATKVEAQPLTYPSGS